MTRILVIDDEVGIRQVITNVLSRYDVTIREAATGLAGFDLAVSQDFDVIIVDFLLPDITGDVIAERYRAAGGLAPIILLSASGDIDKLGQHPAIRAALAKPFRLTQLCQTIEAATNRLLAPPQPSR